MFSRLAIRASPFNQSPEKSSLTSPQGTWRTLVASVVCLAGFVQGSGVPKTLQVLRDQFELPKCGPASCTWRLEGTVEAMTDVIVNQGFLGVLNRAFDSLQLLGKLVAWSPLFDHLYDLAKMAIGSLETLDDRGMVMRHSLFHPGRRLGAILARG
jgi:hypothetical protein